MIEKEENRETHLLFNGVDEEGGRLHPEVSVEALVDHIRGESLDARELGRLRAWTRRNRTRRLGPEEGVDPRSLMEAGWGVIFAEGADPDPGHGEREEEPGDHFGDREPAPPPAPLRGPVPGWSPPPRGCRPG